MSINNVAETFPTGTLNVIRVLVVLGKGGREVEGKLKEKKILNGQFGDP